jgi:hypothetical protein
MAPIILLLPFSFFLFYVCPPYVLNYHGGAEFEGHFKEGVIAGGLGNGCTTRFCVFIIIIVRLSLSRLLGW